MKGTKKILSLMICIAMIFTVIPFSVNAATNLCGDFYYTVEGGKATITALANKTAENIIIPSTVDGYKVIGIGDGAFANNQTIAQLTVSDGILSIGNSAFSSCTNLGSINLADSITYIGEGAFYNCPLNKVKLPLNLTAISAECFSNCYGLQVIELLGNVTAIGSGAFNKCYNLTEIYIPNSVKTIGSNAFLENYCLSNVYYCGNEADWKKIQIGSNNTSLDNAALSFHRYKGTYVGPTCSSLGHSLLTCVICNYSYIIEDTTSSLTDHDYETEFTIDKAATEFEEGVKSRHCKNCSAKTDITPIPRTAKIFGNYSETVEWAITSNGTLVISGSGEIADLKLPVYNPWHEYAEIITALDISKDITRLGNNSFSSLENLKNVTINSPETEFGYYVFPLNFDLIIKCHTGSKADFYAQKIGHISTFFDAPITPVIESIVGDTATLKKVEGYEYSIDRYNWQKSNVFTIEKDVIVTFYQRIAETSTTAASPSSDAAKGISVSAPDVIFVGYDKIAIKPTPDYEYGLEGVLWQEDYNFTKWIIPETTYTVYQRYNGDKDVFAAYDTNGTKITVNGNNKPIMKNAEYLTWLKKQLFENPDSNNIAADLNNDFCVDILDLVTLKTEILSAEF